ncbi:MAG: TetR/AcrR family transcriptional regulator [Lachnospiraceae bacterium]|nr:TetR/AcrR family transcriptional regulator [Lachnospiraceae bacterium]
MGKLDVKKQQKREALLNTAFELFTAKGLNKTSISDIVEQAGVAKGTFYLYFQDKYDLCNKLIAHKASHLFEKAYHAMQEHKPDNIEDKILFITNHIIDALEHNTVLLTFISKNLSWGIFKAALISPPTDGTFDFYSIYLTMLKNDEVVFVEPELMLFFIVELVGSSCYSSILYEEPVPLEQLKPYLFKNIRAIIDQHKAP